MKNQRLAVGYSGEPLSLVDPFVGLYWFDAPAFSITPDTHYVGSRQNSVYLITTPQGHALIETDFGGGSEYFLLSKVVDLGFNPKEIKYILITHKHPDHIGGARRLRDITGARVCAHEKDVPSIEQGEHPHAMETDGSPWEIYGCPVDIVLRGGEEIQIGNKAIRVMHSPGHTSGCLTFTWNTVFDGTEYRAAVSGICGVASFAGLLKGKKDFTVGERPLDFLKSMELLSELKVDFFLGVHQFCNRNWEKHQLLRAGNDPNPFIDSRGWQEWISSMQSNVEKLERGIDIWKGKGWMSEVNIPEGMLDPDEEPRRG